MQHFFQIVVKLMLKFCRNRLSFKFQLKTRIRAHGSLTDFFRENYLKFILDLKSGTTGTKGTAGICGIPQKIRDWDRDRDAKSGNPGFGTGTQN